MHIKIPKKEWAVVPAKITKETYLELQNYCRSTKTSVSSYIRTLLEREKPSQVSLKKAGTTVFRFNPVDDAFFWELHYDDGTKSMIADDLSDHFLEQVKIAIDKALIVRKEHIKQKIGNSLALPRINTLKGRGNYVKG